MSSLISTIKKNTHKNPQRHREAKQLACRCSVAKGQSQDSGAGARSGVCTEPPATLPLRCPPCSLKENRKIECSVGKARDKKEWKAAFNIAHILFCLQVGEKYTCILYCKKPAMGLLPGARAWQGADTKHQTQE